MFYLISLIVGLASICLVLVFGFMPLYQGSSYDILYHTQASADWTLLDYLDTSNGLFMFVLSIAVCILFFVLLAIFSKKYRRLPNMDTLLFVFNVVAVIVSIVFLVFTVRFYKNHTYYYTSTVLVNYSYTKTTFLTLYLAFTIATVVTLLFCLILSIVNKFTIRLKEKKFFSLVGKEVVVEPTVSSQTIIKEEKGDEIDKEMKKYEFISKLKELKDSGVISEEEFNEKKKELL